MDSKTVYSRSLKLKSPWFVEKVEFVPDTEEIHVVVAHRSGRWRCPECGKTAVLHDHAPERVWRHLNTLEYVTLVRSRLPRVSCEEHGVLTVTPPWSDKHSRNTFSFEALVIELYREMSGTAVCRHLKISWSTMWAIIERGVKRGLARRKPTPLPFIGIDEKAIARRHRYVTIVCDLVRGKIEWVGIGRDSEPLSSFFRELPAERLASIEGIATDMWPAFHTAIRDHVPGGLSKIVYDRFHAMQVVTSALDRIRKGEHRALLSAGDRSLAGTRWVWLTTPAKMNERMRERLASVRNLANKTARAWTLKEAFAEMWKLPTRMAAASYFKRWYNWAIRSQLAPMAQAAKKIKRNLDHLLAYYEYPITSALNESLNAQIETIKRVANGIRNPEHFRLAIYFRCGGLDMSTGVH